jgi:hypothetical protein
MERNIYKIGKELYITSDEKVSPSQDWYNEFLSCCKSKEECHCNKKRSIQSTVYPAVYRPFIKNNQTKAMIRRFNFWGFYIRSEAKKNSLPTAKMIVGTIKVEPVTASEKMENLVDQAYEVLTLNRNPIEDNKKLQATEMDHKTYQNQGRRPDQMEYDANWGFRCITCIVVIIALIVAAKYFNLSINN